MSDEYFTVLFKGRIQDLPGNPFLIESVFGKVQTVSIDDVFAERDRLEEEVRRLKQIGPPPS